MSLMRKIYFRQMLIYLGLTLFSVLFTCIYYMNSYGMTDIHMTLVFVPSLTYLVIYLILFLTQYKMSDLTRYIMNMSFPFMYLYMILMGIYTIAKTSSTWLFVYLILFGIGILLAIANEIAFKVKARGKEYGEESKVC